MEYGWKQAKGAGTGRERLRVKEDNGVWEGEAFMDISRTQEAWRVFYEAQGKNVGASGEKEGASFAGYIKEAKQKEVNQAEANQAEANQKGVNLFPEGKDVALRHPPLFATRFPVDDKKPREEMTLDEYKQYICNVISGLPVSASRKMNGSGVLLIKEEAFMQMKKEPAYEKEVVDMLRETYASEAQLYAPDVSYQVIGARKEDCYGAQIPVKSYGLMMAGLRASSLGGAGLGSLSQGLGTAGLYGTGWGSGLGMSGAGELYGLGMSGAGAELYGLGMSGAGANLYGLGMPGIGAGLYGLGASGIGADLYGLGMAGEGISGYGLGGAYGFGLNSAGLPGLTAAGASSVGLAGNGTSGLYMDAPGSFGSGGKGLGTHTVNRRRRESSGAGQTGRYGNMVNAYKKTAESREGSVSIREYQSGRREKA